MVRVILSTTHHPLFAIQYSVSRLRLPKSRQLILISPVPARRNRSGDFPSAAPALSTSLAGCPSQTRLLAPPPTASRLFVPQSIPQSTPYFVIFSHRPIHKTEWHASTASASRKTPPATLTMTSTPRQNVRRATLAILTIPHRIRKIQLLRLLKEERKVVVVVVAAAAAAVVADWQR